MPAKEIALDVAAFLDSPQAQGLDASREQVKRIAEAFLAVCYEDLGKAPHLLDGHDAHEALGHGLPQRLEPRDPLAEHVPAVLTAYFAHLAETRVVREPYEIRRGLDSAEDEFLETVRTGHGGHHHAHAKEKPFVHQAPKTGRNDPCSCGSGKKFKKCHGKAE